MILLIIAIGAGIQGSWWIAGTCGAVGVLQLGFQALVAE